jgi:hypothetical protein
MSPCRNKTTSAGSDTSLAPSINAALGLTGLLDRMAERRLFKNLSIRPIHPQLIVDTWP